MGCIHPKGVKRVEKSTNRTRNYSGLLVGNKTRVESFERRDGVIVGSQGVSSIESSGDRFHHRGWESIELVNVRVAPRDGRPRCVTRPVPMAATGELIAAGWPVWLAVCAGEAIYGMVPRPLDVYERFDMIGSGTYSTVHRVRDPRTGQILALKKVRFDNSLRDSIAFMAREILILRKLDHPNVIKLEGIALSKSKSTLCLIFEYMEHDLLGLTACPDIKFSEPQVKCYMKQLLSGLEYCHARGVMHRDIKGSNLLLNNEGILKIADFGLSNFFTKGEQLTTKMVTLWYRPPELLLGAIHYGPEVDLWSAGCVFAEILRGKPLIKGHNEYFITKPYACDTSSLPKYPAQKEIDVKARREAMK
ncbi:IMPAIRED IN BABA-INDUCED STERILITY 1-like protein [Drosera capensis]